MSVNEVEPEQIDALFNGTAISFSAWRETRLPVAAGVYTVWNGSTFIYVGMSGNLRDRLRSHASGRRGGDQFCIYVCDRLVIPDLTTVELAALAKGQLSLDSATREYIEGSFAFRFLETPTVAEARRIEEKIRGGALVSGVPLLNPRTGRRNDANGR